MSRVDSRDMMDTMDEMDIAQYWRDTLRQDAGAMRRYFREDAHINWHNTNERFTVEEFIRANCEYPGQWDGEIQRLEQLGTLYITVVRVWDSEGRSFHVTSFMQLRDGQIASVDEYWGDDGPAPQWRLDKHIGTKILEA